MSTETKPAKGSLAYYDELTGTPDEIEASLEGTELEPVGEFYRWSLNYEPGRNPWSVFLDLIGWSTENLGEPISDLKHASEIIGYYEACELGRVLILWGNTPKAVEAVVEAYNRAEAGE